MDICVLTAPPRVRSRVCAQAVSVRKPGSSRPVPTSSSCRPRTRRSMLPTLGSSCQLISTVTETKQGVTPRENDAWARQILYNFTTVGPTGWCVAMPLRCGRRGSVGCLGGPRCTNDADEREPNERRSRADDRLRRAFRVSCACAPGASGKIGSLSRSRERCSDELKQGIKHKKRQLKDGKWLACPA